MVNSGRDLVYVKVYGIYLGKQFTLPMRTILSTLIICLALIGRSEGTKELAPNASVIVSGKQTTDAAALFIGQSEQGNFASYYSQDLTSKLYVHIIEPATECIYLGFGKAKDRDRIAAEFRFHVYDPLGVLIYSSEVIGENHSQINNWQEAFNGPNTFDMINGYEPVHLSSAILTSGGNSVSGDYYILFENVEHNDVFYISWWDITVANCVNATPIERKGRLWSNNWVLFTPAVDDESSWFDRPFNGSFYIVAPDSLEAGHAFITRMNFNGADFRPAAFGVALNSFGASRTGSVAFNRRSRSYYNLIMEEYPIFLNDPIELFQTADEGTIELLPSTGCIPINFCFQFISTKPGEAEVLLDFFGENGIYDEGSADVVIPVAIHIQDIGQSICVPWDGLDGLGQKYDGRDLEMLNYYISYRQGIFHFPIYDAENNEEGFRLEKIRPVGEPPLLYYDDSNISFDSKTGSPHTALGGCVTPCHTWRGNTYEHSYGNLNLINSWWYARDLKDQGRVELRFAKEEVLDISFCVGDSIRFADSTMRKAGDHIFYYNTRFGCDSLIIYRLNVIKPLAFVTSSFQNLTCDHPVVTLSSEGSAPRGQLDYYWTGSPDIMIQNNTDPEIEIDLPGLYTLEVRVPDVGCRANITVEIINQISYPTFNVKNIPKFGCQKEEQELSMELLEPIGSYTVNWHTADGKILKGSNLLKPTISEAGTYFFELTYLYNECSVTDSIIVVRDTNSYLEINAPISINGDFCNQIEIIASLNSEAYSDLMWTPSENLSCNACLNPMLLAMGNDQFTLTLKDSNQCELSHTVTIDLKTDYKLFVPNSFSPNNDGINDRFSIYSSACAVDVMSFSIYDLWGARVFNRKNFLSTDTDIGWDGQTLDNPIPVPGVYVYAIELELHDGTHTVLKGDLTLVR